MGRNDTGNREVGICEGMFAINLFYFPKSVGQETSLENEESCLKEGWIIDALLYLLRLYIKTDMTHFTKDY